MGASAHFEAELFKRRDAETDTTTTTDDDEAIEGVPSDSSRASEGTANLTPRKNAICELGTIMILQSIGLCTHDGVVKLLRKPFPSAKEQYDFLSGRLLATHVML